MKKTQNFWDGKNPFPPWHLLPLGSPKLSSLRSSKGKNCLIPTSFLAGDRSTRISDSLCVGCIGFTSPKGRKENSHHQDGDWKSRTAPNLAKCHWLGEVDPTYVNEEDWKGILFWHCFWEIWRSPPGMHKNPHEEKGKSKHLLLSILKDLFHQQHSRRINPPISPHKWLIFRLRRRFTMSIHRPSNKPTTSKVTSLKPSFSCQF